MKKLIFLLLCALVLFACSTPPQQRVIHPSGIKINCKIYQSDTGAVAIYRVAKSP